MLVIYSPGYDCANISSQTTCHSKRFRVVQECFIRETWKSNFFFTPPPRLLPLFSIALHRPRFNEAISFAGAPSSQKQMWRFNQRWRADCDSAMKLAAPLFTSTLGAVIVTSPCPPPPVPGIPSRASQPTYSCDIICHAMPTHSSSNG